MAKAWQKHLHDSSGIIGRVWVMGALMMATTTTGCVDGLVFGVITGFAFRFGTQVMHNRFARRSKE